MNGRQAIEAMLQGKVVQQGSFLYRFSERGFETYGPGSVEWVSRGFFARGTYELYQEPNLHEPGTYAWAREEHARGHCVENAHGYNYDQELKWHQFAFSHAEFETKTWRRA